MNERRRSGRFDVFRMIAEHVLEALFIWLAITIAVSTLAFMLTGSVIVSILVFVVAIALVVVVAAWFAIVYFIG